MSRNGSKPVNTENVEVNLKESELHLKGPKGELKVDILDFITIDVTDNEIIVKRKDNSKRAKERHGLVRALVRNAVEGVRAGYQTKLELRGIGYRVQKKGSDLEFSLGYSNPVLFKVPAGVTAETEGTDKVLLSSIDKQLLGETCAQILKIRKRDPYKGKGIYFEGEVVKNKPGKSVKK